MQYIRVLVLERLFERVYDGEPDIKYGLKYKSFDKNSDPVEIFSLHKSEADIERYVMVVWWCGGVVVWWCGGVVVC